VSILQKKIDVTFIKTRGSFTAAPTQSNTLRLSGLRVSCRILRAGSPAKNTSEVTVFGMTRSQMDDLSTLGLVVKASPTEVGTLALAGDLVRIDAGDDQTGMSLVFVGTIHDSYADYSAMPDVGFHLSATTGLAESVFVTEATASSTFPGVWSFSDIVKRIADAMNVSVQDYLTYDPVLTDAYFVGGPFEQIQAAAEDCRIDADFVDDHLELRNIGAGPGAPRSFQTVKISRQTGLMRYPIFNSRGIRLEVAFNPALRRHSLVEVTSDVHAAEGIWRVVSLSHELECQVPGGRWQSTLDCWNPNSGPAVPR
jgi:hypothetical protein